MTFRAQLQERPGMAILELTGDLDSTTAPVFRDKVEEEPSSPLLLRTVRGIGYCWDADPSTAVTPPVISNP